MKLDKSHIGKKVRIIHYPENEFELINLHENQLWLRRDSGNYCTMDSRDDFEILERKKPSERIYEIVREIHGARQPSKNSTELELIDSIISFLDEEWEAKKENR